ncbi:unnamed protein product [Rotaria sp. Silwood2]|nr:unnamed protein product [Rotaria sp. Silwood2]
MTTCQKSINNQFQSSTGTPSPLPTIYQNLTQTTNCSQTTIDYTEFLSLCLLGTSPFFDAALCQYLPD